MPTTTFRTPLFDALSAALGGRRIAVMLWGCWFVGALGVFQATDQDYAHSRESPLLWCAAFLVSVLVAMTTLSCFSTAFREWFISRTKVVVKPTRTAVILIRISGYGLGYWLWLSSAFVVVFGTGLILSARAKTTPRPNESSGPALSSGEPAAGQESPPR